jgi:hypothetical protein
LIPLLRYSNDLLVCFGKFRVGVVPLAFCRCTRLFSNSNFISQIGNLRAQLLGSAIFLRCLCLRELIAHLTFRLLRRLNFLLCILKLGSCFLQTRADGFLFSSGGFEIAARLFKRLL